MDLAVLFLGTSNLSSSRAVPADLTVYECRSHDACDTARNIDARHLLVVEPDAYASAQTFAAARSLESDGGILGGYVQEPDGTRRFGAVFATVEFGPYGVEPFPLIDPRGGAAQQPQSDAIDVVAPGVFVIDRECFCAIGGFDSTLSSPWRVYDLCMRIRDAGKPVRWSSKLGFGVEVGVVRVTDAVDRRDFSRKWENRLRARFDLDTPARGVIRRVVRSPLGQRDVVTIPIPPTEVVLYGDGALTPKLVRTTTRAQRVTVTDARGEDGAGLHAFRQALRTRSDRYVALLNAATTPEEGWLERMLVELESRPNLRGIRKNGTAAIALSRIPLDMNLPSQMDSVPHAIDAVLSKRPIAGRTLSIVLVAHSTTPIHRTSFESIYAGELEIDYHAVVTPARPDSVAALKSHATLDVIVDESRGMAAGVNEALARARGDVVIVIADDFYPPPGWLETVREAFSLRPDMGILGFSAVFVDGPQNVDVAYADMTAFKALATRRREALARDARLTDTLTALALAVDRRALQSVGGFDKKLGAGRWGVEDLTMRMRRAGYAAYVAEDLFAHHFGPDVAQPFLNDPVEENRRAQVFAQKWKARVDFDPSRDFVALV